MGKLDAILNAAKRALGAGEKGFVGDAGEQLAKVRTTTAPPKAPAGKPEGMAVTGGSKDDAWAAAKAKAEAAKPAKPADPWDQTPELSAEHRRAAAAVESRLGQSPNAGANLKPAKPATTPTPPEAPAGMRVEPAKPARAPTADEKWAAARARAEGRPLDAPPVSTNTGGLSLQQPGAAPTRDSAWARAKQAAEGDHFAPTTSGIQPARASIAPTATPEQLRQEAWDRAQAASRTQAQDGVSMSRLTEAQQRDQAWNRARGADLPAIDMPRLDTSGIGPASPVGSAAAPPRRNGPGSSGPGG